jgi:hypothetical protein
MLKLVCSLFFLSFTTLIMAQQGSVYFGGSVGFNSYTEINKDSSGSVKEPAVTTWVFSPEIGTFLSDNIQLGVALNILGSKDENQKKSGFGGTPYCRYFFDGDEFRPFIGLNATFLTQKNTIEYFSNTSVVNSFGVGANFNGGFSYALSDRITAVGSLAFLGFNSVTSQIEGDDDKTTVNIFGINANTLGNYFNIGLYFTL